ncbi:hypothetical protein [Salinibacterium sp.]|uniref:hypothetical protein n=1 Tax=Salinibacterium sp. TaxID=1915057 RepID=UPI00286A6431|nr:hypothetical protein [Salinibacterium sp.]
MNHSRLAATAAALMVSALALTGCVGGAAPKPTPTATATGQQPGITDIIDTPGSGAGLEGALSDSEVTTCELASGAWTVAGTLTNSSAVAANYRVYVSLLAADGDTRALTQVNVNGVEPSLSSPWTTEIAVADEALSCVLRVERYPVSPPPTEETAPPEEG